MSVLDGAICRSGTSSPVSIPGTPSHPNGVAATQGRAWVTRQQGPGHLSTGLGPPAADRGTADTFRAWLTRQQGPGHLSAVGLS